ncbi:hypothetical protein D3C76_1617770 [compost metagenome]
MLAELTQSRGERLGRSQSIFGVGAGSDCEQLDAPVVDWRIEEVDLGSEGDLRR